MDNIHVLGQLHFATLRGKVSVSDNAKNVRIYADFLRGTPFFRCGRVPGTQFWYKEFGIKNLLIFIFAPIKKEQTDQILHYWSHFRKKIFLSKI